MTVTLLYATRKPRRSTLRCRLRASLSDDDGVFASRSDCRGHAGTEQGGL